MKRVLISLFLAGAVCSASVSIPVVTPDGVPLMGSAIGAQLLPNPGSVMGACGNDNPITTPGVPGDDGDCNEPIVTLVFGSTQFAMALVGNDSGWSNYFTVTGQTSQQVGLAYSPFAIFNYTPGVTVPLEYHTQDGNIYTPGSPNMGEWCISGDCQQSATPEPSTYLMLGSGLIAMGWLRRVNLLAAIAKVYDKV